MSTSLSQRSLGSRKPRTNITRRCWSPIEEQHLITSLKDIVSRGWKSDNGFRTGYLGVLEQHMALKFPGTDIKADPMILSKLHVWKKQYGSLSQMLSRSGFCWNESANTIDVIDDQVWNDYVKFDSNARLMRYKSWPYFKDWTIIFGKDRATGESAEALADAINDISKQDKEAGDDSMGGDHIPQPAMHSNENDSENMSSLHGEGYMSNMQGEGTSTSHQSRGKKKGNKRSRNDDLDGRIVDMMADMTRTFAETKTCLGELAHRIGFEHDASTTRKKVLDALSPLCLGVEDKITVAKAVCNSPTDLDIFFGLNETEKGVMVRMILEGRYFG